VGPSPPPMGSSDRTSGAPTLDAPTVRLPAPGRRKRRAAGPREPQTPQPGRRDRSAADRGARAFLRERSPDWPLVRHTDPLSPTPEAPRLSRVPATERAPLLDPTRFDASTPRGPSESPASVPPPSQDVAIAPRPGMIRRSPTGCGAGLHDLSEDRDHAVPIAAQGAPCSCRGAGALLRERSPDWPLARRIGGSRSRSRDRRTGRRTGQPPRGTRGPVSRCEPVRIDWPTRARSTMGRPPGRRMRRETAAARWPGLRDGSRRPCRRRFTGNRKGAERIARPLATFARRVSPPRPTPGQSSRRSAPGRPRWRTR
jgi:hypothetical protein